MKSLNSLKQLACALIAVAAFSNIAIAGNEGPQAAPQLPEPTTTPAPTHGDQESQLPANERLHYGFVVATVTSSTGWPPPGVCSSYKYTVYSTGEVFRTDCDVESEVKITVSLKWIDYVLKYAKDLKSEPLVLLNPNAPKAADAGVETYYVHNGDLQMIAIGGIDDMRELVRVGHRRDGSDQLRLAIKQLLQEISRAKK